MGIGLTPSEFQDWGLAQLYAARACLPDRLRKLRAMRAERFEPFFWELFDALPDAARMDIADNYTALGANRPDTAGLAEAAPSLPPARRFREFHETEFVHDELFEERFDRELAGARASAKPKKSRLIIYGIGFLLLVVLPLMIGRAMAQESTMVCPPQRICAGEEMRQSRTDVSPQDAIGTSAPRGDPAKWCHELYALPRFAVMTPAGREHKEKLCADEQWRRANR